MGKLNANAESTNPTPNSEYVIEDYANILSDNTKQIILNQDKKYQQTETKPQIVVMTVKSTGDLSIADYADKLLENDRWKFGKKGLDNGTLILFAQNGGKNNVRISTGYGVEGILPDGKTNQILQNNKSLLKSSNSSEVDNGLQQTFQDVASIVSKEYANKSVKDAKATMQANQRKKYTTWVLLFILLGIVGVIIYYLKKNNNDDNNHHNHYGGGSGGGDNGFWTGALIGSLLGSGGSRSSGSDFGSFGGGDSGGFSDSGGGGDFGGGGSDI
ncbi:TPM domain-containing protein [Apilactobacillus apisilvae]|uniref:TPM domain-containing protein n=1 Tax=Apilactobacillus apisilvae TaxID=2923364 RepID=A0ABY4PH55_9LACO|nr:TPM domain-containing protein [Apilactobacillus apisilvae]UQS84917.1 TPM domain-containing protein [Apilactobacillus apisilvae]